MRSAFDSIKEAEQSAEEKITNARQKINELMQDAADQIAAKESHFARELSTYQNEIMVTEEKSIKENTLMFDKKREQQKIELNEKYTKNGEAVRDFIIKKVLEQNGDR